MASALALLEEEGTKDLSLRRAARVVGVSRTAPLHHFGNKEGLLAAIAAEGFRILVEYRRRNLERVRSPAKRLRAVMLAYVEFSIDHPALFQLMFGPEIPNKALYPELEEAATRSYAILGDCVAELLHGLGRSAEEIRRATLAAWAACHGIATIILDRQNSPSDRPRKDPIRTANEIFDVVIAGMSV